MPEWVTPQLAAYFGSVEQVNFQTGQAFRAYPAAENGRLRIASEQFFAPPLRFSGWVMPASGESKNATDGMHVHVGHVSNELNFACSLSRVDDLAVVKREADRDEYDVLPPLGADGEADYDANAYVASPFHVWRRYNFTVDWWDDRIRMRVSSTLAAVDLTVAVMAQDRAGESVGVPASGQVGFRFDNFETLYGGLVVSRPH